MNKMPSITHHNALSRVLGMKNMALHPDKIVTLLLFPGVFLLIIAIMVLPSSSFSQTNPVPYTLEDRDRNIRMEEQIKSLNIRMDKMDEEIKSLRQEVNARFESMQTFLYWGFGIMFGSLLSLVGFVLWDRRTFLKPVQLQVQDIDVSLNKERNNIRNLIAALKELAKEDVKVAQALKQFNLL